MQTHELKLATEPFEAIASGRKTIESRLYDEKRQAIELGDLLVFTNREDPSQNVQAQVCGLLRYTSFDELFTSVDPTKFGGTDKGWLMRQIREFYSEDEERQLGVVAIQFKLTQ
jgi:ASC-1-like (ASCH) protein